MSGAPVVGKRSRAVMESEAPPLQSVAGTMEEVAEVDDTSEAENDRSKRRRVTVVRQEESEEDSDEDEEKSNCVIS